MSRLGWLGFWFRVRNRVRVCMEFKGLGSVFGFRKGLGEIKALKIGLEFDYGF